MAVYIRARVRAPRIVRLSVSGLLQNYRSHGKHTNNEIEISILLTKILRRTGQTIRRTGQITSYKFDPAFCRTTSHMMRRQRQQAQ